MSDTKPDYGVYLINKGYNPDMRHHFILVPINNIGFCNRNLATSISAKIVEGQEYAVSFDFTAYKFMELVKFASPKTKDFLKSKLNDYYSDNGFIPSTEGLIFPEPIIVTITCRFGELVDNGYDTFIPLEVMEIRG
ncbi:MAG: hypothetical protein P9M05_11630 [Candidatus Stygibacter australis]|nr:hypothetical protein [Candidatus Stygibacter australis]